MPDKPQHRITQPGPLHDERGRLTQRGYATSLLLQYDRSRVAASPLRIKEWDYYYIGNDSFGLALTIDDNGYMSLDSISLLDFDAKWEQTTSRMGFMPLGRRKLPLENTEWPTAPSTKSKPSTAGSIWEGGAAK